VKNIINRNYLEILSLEELIESNNPSDKFILELVEPPNFQLNKFFYKNIGKNHKWVDRLIWNEKQWIDYTTNTKVKTFVLKKGDDLVGYFELIFHNDKNEIEIAYFGLLEEYRNQKLGSYLLSLAIKESFKEKPSRVWLHTCSLDHKNALNNYLSRGMKIFKKETVSL
tara:strand:- start:2678 stop:3181 length:504 start_codon:yes stop_codon:yes gene_type:complete